MVSTDLEPYYGNLQNYVRMVANDYTKLLLLDARGGIGKTYQVRQTLSDELDRDQWMHRKGFTTPIELFKTLYRARHEDSVLFLDDMGGLTNNQKAVNMLKAATETDGAENFVEYHTSRDIDHPTEPGVTMPNTFGFRGSIIISFNETPDNRHFDALCDRGVEYHLDFTYDEMCQIIRVIAQNPDFSPLSVEEQQATAEWVIDVTDASFEVTIRTFEEVCQMRKFGQDTERDWEKMAYEVFDLDWKMHRIIELRRADEMSIEEQIAVWRDETGMSERHYYDLLDEVKDRYGV